MKILVVEDDEQLQRIFRTLLSKDPVLQRRNPEIVVAKDGVDALELVKKTVFQLVITDLLMPRMNGFEFCSRLRKEPNGERVPLIVSSAVYRDAQMMQKLERETGCQFFAKPFQVPELLAAIRAKLDQPLNEPPRPAPIATGDFPAKGDLIALPPARLLLDAWEKRLSGRLVLTRGKVQKDVALVNGTPVAITSNVRNETLGHFLLQRNKITDTQHQSALALARSKNLRLGAALVELGLLNQATLLAELTAQHEHKLFSVLRWKDGGFQFTAGSPTERPPGAVDLPFLLFLGLRRTARPDEIERAFRVSTEVVELTPRWPRLRERFTSVFGREEIERLEARPRVDRLLAQAEDSDQRSSLLIQLDALLICDLAQLAAAPVSTETAPSPAAAARATSPTSEPDHGLEERLGDLFADVEPPPAAPPVVDQSGLLGVSDPAPQQAERQRERDATQTEVLDLYLRLLGRSHYEILDIPPDAKREQIETGYRRRMAQIQADRFEALPEGEERDKLREVKAWIREAFEVLCDEASRHTYDGRGQHSSVSPSVDAELKAQMALEKLADGFGQDACQLLEEAAEAAPDQPDYQAQLGWARYVAAGALEDIEEDARAQAAASAASALAQALALDPDHVPAHRYAATIALQQGHTEEALSHWEHILAVDPWNAEILALYDSNSTDPRRLERQLRKLIHRLTGTASNEAMLPLWLRLGELYRGRLDDRDSSLTAFSVAARLVPQDPRPHAALARVYREQAADQPKAIHELRTWWNLQPDDLDAGRGLFQLHLRDEAWDRALLCGQVLLHRGCQDDAIVELVRRYQARFLIRAQQPLSARLLDRVRHLDDLTTLCRLFEIVERIVPSPYQLTDLGLSGVAPIDPVRQLPDAARDVLIYVARQLGVDLPRLYLRPELGTAIHVGATDAPVLLLGERALGLPKIELAFRAARALSFCWPGRARPSALPSRQLRWLFLSAVTLVKPELPVDDPDGEVRKLRERLLPRRAELLPHLTPLVSELLTRDQLSLTSFARGITRTADRVGFLLCGHLTTAADVTAAEGAEGAADDLLDFALSDEAAEARRALGHSVDV